jgi:hypothetical protein
MVPMDRKVVGAAVAAAAALAIGLGVAAVARADDVPSSGTPSAAANTTPGPAATGQGRGNGQLKTHGPGDGKGWGPGGRFGGGVALGAEVADLATRLGVAESTLRDALKGAKDDLKAAHQATGALRSGQRDAALDAFADALAKRLGLSSSTVRTALDEVRASHDADRQQAFDDRLDQAVKDGTLTQAEADAVRKAARAGVIGMGRGPR